MNKICTDLEQSKKLVELGIDVNTADMIWIEDYLGYDSNGNRKHGEYRLYGDMLIPAYGQDSVPAWSLSALLGLMPIINDSTYKMCGTLDGGALISHEELTCAMFQENNPLDAAFELVVWLKENGKL